VRGIILNEHALAIHGVHTLTALRDLLHLLVVLLLLHEQELLSTLEALVFRQLILGLRQ
jgi:hypothetical protein